MAYEVPGVYVREVPSQAQVSVQSTATVAAFLGTALRGPTVPTLINSWSAYVANFGPLSNDYDLGYAVYNYFANGGRDAYVTRVIASDATASAVTPTGTIASVATNLFTLTSKTKGSWANSVSATTGMRATITYDVNSVVSASSSAITIDNDTVFSLVLTVNGQEVERWQELSIDPTSGRYIADVLSLFSVYTTCNTPVVIASGSSMVVPVDTNTYSFTYSFGSGTNGVAAIDATSWETAVEGHDGINVPLLINFVGQTSASIVNKALDYAAARGDSFVIIDCAKDADVSAVTSQAGSYGGNKAYGALYFPALKMADAARTGPAAIRTTFPGGAVAGAYVRSETTRGVAKAPAGYSLDLRNVYGLAATVTEAQEATLYNTKHVNVFRSVPGGTFIINGARTLATNRPDKFVTVRRSMNYLKAVLKAQTAFAVFEPNDERLWAKINNTLSNTLTNFWGTGNLRGNTAAEAFYIICDSTNNTSTTINDGYVNVEVGVSLLNPAEFIVITVSQWAGEATA